VTRKTGAEIDRERGLGPFAGLGCVLAIYAALGALLYLCRGCGA